MLRPLLLKRSLRLHNHHDYPSSTPSHSQPLRTLTPPNPFLRRFSSLPEPNADAETRKYIGYAALLLFCGAATYYSFPLPENAKHKKAQIFRYAPLPEDLHTVSNWSGTHEVQTRNFHQPESIDELERVVSEAHKSKTRIRPVGSGLSPNGIGLSRIGMVNLSLMDSILEVDEKKKIVRVQAGIRVQQLVDGIKEHGLTLQNFASIREQQIGGIIQVVFNFILVISLN
jgi:L-galactono-1,4-lactone dehydrogenase